MNLLQALLNLREHGPTKPWFGICLNLDQALTDRTVDAYDWIATHAKAWPEYSGDEAYPVPHPTCDPRDAFNDTENLWDTSTEYGRARYRLLDFLIECAEQEAA